MSGGRGDDTLLGGDGNDLLVGGNVDGKEPPPPPKDLRIAEAAIIIEEPGLNGDDQFEGGAGFDTIEGGVGFDTATYSGNRNDYGIRPGKGEDLLVSDARENSPDGFDVLRGIEKLVFADGSVLVADLFGGGNADPTVTSNGGGDTATTSVLENSTAVTTLTANDAETPAGNLSFTIAGGADASLFELRHGNELHFVDAPDFENLPIDMGAPGYEVIVEVADGDGGIDRQTITVGVDNQLGQIISSNLAVLNGAGEEDVLIAGAGNNKLNGAGGNDFMDGGDGRDTMTGGFGDDTYVVNSSDRVIEAADGGTDMVHTGLASYTLAAHVENLRSVGTGKFKGTGNDLGNQIAGGIDDDTLDGKAGNDTIVGGAGKDKLIGGAGADLFVIGEGLDTITDFSSVDDTILLNMAQFGSASVTGGALDASDLFVGKLSLATGGQHFVYDRGKLYYDADGAGSGAAAVQFASLGKATLSAADLTFDMPLP